MAVTQVYTAIPNDVITAARWNNEFGNIYNNGTVVAFPLTQAVSFAGFTITLDAAGVVTLSAAAGTATLTGTFAVAGSITTTGSITATGSITTTGSLNVGSILAGKVIGGLTYSNSGTDNIIVAIGEAASDDAVLASRRLMVLASALTKNITTAWAVGSGNGGLDTGSVGNNDYYIWLIQRADTGVVDVLFSLSATAPTMPTNYAFKRLIGWFPRRAAANILFTTYEISGGGTELWYNAPTIDISLTNTLTTSRRTDALLVPLNFSVRAYIRLITFDATVTHAGIVCSSDEPDAAPSNTVVPLLNMRESVANISGGSDMIIRTSAAGLIASRSSLATVDTYNVMTLGFILSRRQ
jgi:hypothetical protein